MPADILALLSHGLVASTASGGCDYPIEGDVREGVEYADGTMEGTLFVPEVSSPEGDWSPAQVIRYLLIDLGIASDPSTVPLLSWPVYRNRQPDRPDNLIVVNDVSGTAFGDLSPTKQRVEHHGITITVRAAKYEQGYPKAREIAEALDQVSYQTVSLGVGGLWNVRCVTRSTEVIALGADEPTGKRQLFTINAVTPMSPC